MATTTNFSVRMDSDIKKQCEAMYGELGINLTTCLLYTSFFGGRYCGIGVRAHPRKCTVLVSFRGGFNAPAPVSYTHLGGEVGGDNIHIVAGTHRLFLLLDGQDVYKRQQQDRLCILLADFSPRTQRPNAGGLPGYGKLPYRQYARPVRGSGEGLSLIHIWARSSPPARAGAPPAGRTPPPGRR